MNSEQFFLNEDWIALKNVIRANGYIPTRKVVFGMVAQAENEIDRLRICNIDELLFEDYAKREEERKRKSYNCQRRITNLLRTLAGAINPAYLGNRHE